MKPKILFLLAILLLSFGCINIGDLFKSDNKKSDPETTVLPPCELKTTFLGEFETEALILKKTPESDFLFPYIIPVAYEGKVYLTQKYAENVCKTRRICNFPQYAIDWDVPEEGLPVILKGKSYVYDGFQPHSADHILYDLELLTIKKK
jgi:hypothetical protein